MEIGMTSHQDLLHPQQNSSLFNTQQTQSPPGQASEVIRNPWIGKWICHFLGTVGTETNVIRPVSLVICFNKNQTTKKPTTNHWALQTSSRAVPFLGCSIRQAPKHLPPRHCSASRCWRNAASHRSTISETSIIWCPVLTPHAPCRWFRSVSSAQEDRLQVKFNHLRGWWWLLSG